MAKLIDRIRDAFRTEEQRAREEAFRALRNSPGYKKRIENLSSGYYRGDRRGRSLGEWVTSDADANEMLSYSLTDLRNDSNDLYVNNPIGSGAINTYVTNVVGTGLKLSPAIDHEVIGLTPEQADAWQAKTEREYELFCKTADITRQSSMAELQQIVLRSTLLSGDIFANLPIVERNGVVYETCINLIEGQRVSNPNSGRDTESMIMGIEIDKNGAPTKFHYSTGGSYGTTKVWKSLRAFDDTGERACLHVFRKLRANQMRGAPLLAPIIELVKKIDTYSQAEVDAAVINAFFTVFIKKRASAEGALPFDGITNMGAESGASASDKDLKLGSGTIIELFDDEEGVDLANPQRPNANFTAFFEAIVSEIALGVNLPKEVLMKTFNASYSASRGAILEAVKVFKEWEQFLITEFCQPVYEAFLYEAVSRGRIEAPGFLEDPIIRQAYCATEWIGTEQSELNPMVAANASSARIEAGTSNVIIETQARGRDYGKVLRGAQRAQRMRGADEAARAENQSGEGQG